MENKNKKKITATTTKFKQLPPSSKRFNPLMLPIATTPPTNTSHKTIYYQL